MKNVMILTGHGEYAKGIRSNLTFIAGENEDLYAVDFLIDDTEETLKAKFKQILDETVGANYVFICDLLGGTPFRCAAGLSQQQPGIEVVCGITTGSLMEALFLKDTMSIEELAQSLVNKSHESCVRFEMINKVKTASDSLESDQDGI